MNKMSIIELKQLREIADNEINNRLDVNKEFYQKILKLKSILDSFSNKGIAINIEGDDLQKVIDETIYYFNYIKPSRKLKRKPPVQYRLEQAA